jgi:3-oxoacyl-[acyl-carrier protein] reductase
MRGDSLVIDLHGRVALVTAASKGLGAEIVRELAKQGADVAFTYLRDEAGAADVVRAVENMGRRAMAVRADAADFPRAGSVVEEVCRAWGSVHILVCNAGFARVVSLANMQEVDWDKVIAVSLKGAFNYLRAVTPVFANQENGKVVLIGSINGLRGRVGTLSYNAAKAGLVGMAKTAAAELGRYNVNVNVVAPGYIETPSQADTPELIRDLVLKECAIKRLGTPQDIAPVVAFLASDAARHVTGQVLRVDAGQYL